MSVPSVDGPNQIKPWCRVCLVSHLRMKSIQNIGLRTVYDRLTNTQVKIDQSIPEMICYICYSQLRRALRFYEIAQKSQMILKEMQQQGVELNKIIMPNFGNGLNLSMSEVVNVDIPYMLEIDTNPHVAHNIDAHYQVNIEPNCELEIECDNTSTDNMCIEDTHVVIENNIMASNNDNAEVAMSVTDKSILPTYDKEEMLVSDNTAIDNDNTAIDNDNTAIDKVFPENTPLIIVPNEEEKYILGDTNRRSNHEEEEMLVEENTNLVTTKVTVQDETFFVTTHFKDEDIEVIDLLDEDDAEMNESDQKSLLKEIHSEPVNIIDADTSSQNEFVFGNEVTLPNGVKISTGERHFAFVAKTGEKQNTNNDLVGKVSNINTMEANTSNISDKKVRHSCQHCPKVFSNRKQLRLHVEKHGIVYACNVCNKTYQKKFNIKRHMLTHAVGKPFHCKVCLIAFSSLTDYKLHLKSHPEQMTFSCDVCDDSFNEKSSLVRHQEMHTFELNDDSLTPSQSGVFNCQYCDKQFKMRRFLSAHLRKHSDEKEYVCKVCGMVYLTDETLQYHMVKSHNFEPKYVKQYACEYCDKRYSRKSSLYFHLKTHIKDRPIMRFDVESSVYLTDVRGAPEPTGASVSTGALASLPPLSPDGPGLQ